MTIPIVPNPIDLIREWMEEAEASPEVHEPSAVTLATVTERGTPSARIVLAKSIDDEGIVFYTNLESPKATQLNQTPQASLCFYWMPLNKQIRVEGSVERVSDPEADAYFASRPLNSQLGAWASKQSSELSSEGELVKRVAKYAAKFAARKVPRPDFWSGYRVVPERIEFWNRKPYRLHERLSYERIDSDTWRTKLLYP